MHLCPEPNCLEYCSCHDDISYEMRPAPDECWHSCTETPAPEPADVCEITVARAMGLFCDLAHVTNDLESCAEGLDAPLAELIKDVVTQLDHVIDRIVELSVMSGEPPEETPHA